MPASTSSRGVTRDELFRDVEDARQRTLLLVADLEDVQLEVPKLATVNPMRWELGHVAFFYEVFFLRELGESGGFLPGADALFDSFHVDHARRWHLPLPDRRGILDYMNDVLDAVRTRLSGGPASQAESYLARLATLHEDMHGEALAGTRQRLHYAEPQLVGRPAPGSDPVAGDVLVPGGRFELGARPDAPFVFDNEKWGHPVDVPAFRIARAPVTQAEFAAFVDDGGYFRRELWSDEGWIARNERGEPHPLYWARGGDGWQRRHFDRLVPLEPRAPMVHVSWYEAQAYCRWAHRRLPSEAEWEMAALSVPGSDEKRLYPWGGEPPDPSRANLDALYAGLVDVDALTSSDSAHGCRQMLGNVWEWTESSFYPFPGYVVDLPYREYSAPWFGYHKVLRGGCWVTRSRVARGTYRNFFLPDRADVFAGFRTCAVKEV